MKQLDYLAAANDALTQIKGKGAFLTAQAGDDVNTMTIGWAQIGFIWGRPMLSVLVRLSRHTFGIIERAKDFTVSVPSTDMSKELAFCGSTSGRNCNKFEKCKLTLFPSIKVHTPILQIPGIHYECKLVYKSPIGPQTLIEEYQHLYPEKDYHTIYYGEIVDCYSTADEAKQG